MSGDVKNKTAYGALDGFRLLAALLVVAIHTSPLSSVDPTADFLLTRVVARLAVPFFFLCSGFFLLPPYFCGPLTARRRASAAPMLRFLRKALLLYAAGVALYLPVNIYAQQLPGLDVGAWLRLLLIDGSFYHLWYFPALICGVLLLWGLGRILPYKYLLPLCLLLYLVGLGGDSYYGLSSRLPALNSLYQTMFSCFSYTRNGLFMAPLFLALGAGLPSYLKREHNCGRRAYGCGLVLSLAAMCAEALLLRQLGWQRHDSMYLLLPLCLLFLLLWLLSHPQTPHRQWRDLSAAIYMLHPLCIIGVRGVADLLDLGFLLIDNSPVHYLLVSCCSLVAAYIFSRLRQLLPRRQAASGTASPATCGRAWIELDIAALEHNLHALQALLPCGCRLMPVLKANAYGHGALLIADQLQQLGVADFAVATAQEGRELRRGGVKGQILVLGCTAPVDFGLLRRYRLSQSVIDLDYALSLDNWAADRHGWTDWLPLTTRRRKLRVHLAVDSGMRRLGQRSEDIAALRQVFECQHLQLDAVYTHYCCGGDSCAAAADFTPQQLSSFQLALQQLRDLGCHIPQTHSMSSCTLLHYPQAGGELARVGLALYGAMDAAASGQTQLRPVLSLKARVAQVKPIYAGEGAGYELSYVAPRDGRLAVLSIGYADGVPRCLSNGVGRVLLRGQVAPIVGLVCMDMLLVDVSHIPGVAAGDVAVLIGSCNGATITVCQLARQARTISNEILSRLGPRLTRVLC